MKKNYNLKKAKRMAKNIINTWLLVNKKAKLDFDHLSNSETFCCDAWDIGTQLQYPTRKYIVNVGDRKYAISRNDHYRLTFWLQRSDVFEKIGCIDAFLYDWFSYDTFNDLKR